VKGAQQPPPCTGPTLDQLAGGPLPAEGRDRIGVVEDRLVQTIVLVDDLRSARRRMEASGFTVRNGGRHPGRGTANLIVPFGTQYLELLAIVDEAEARSSPQGRPVVSAWTSRGPGLARWSVEPADIDATAVRVGHPIERRHRVLPDGTIVRWRSVAVDTAWAEPWRSAFMTWDDPHTHPARSVVVHANGATGFARLEVVAPDMVSARAWFGEQIPPGVIMGVGPRPDVKSLHLRSPSGEIPVE
jgi:Glyoxalase-like domain